MFNIYEKEGEPMTDGQKVRFLFKKVQHNGLQSAIDALRALQTKGTEVTFSEASSHLATTVSELPEYISRNQNVSGVTSQLQSLPTKGIYNENGKIFTGHIPHWSSLTQDKKNKPHSKTRTPNSRNSKA